MKDRTVKRVNLRGPFAGEDLGAGRWRLSRTGPAPIDVFLRVADGTAAEVLAEPGIIGLDLDWRSSGVTAAVTGRRGVQRVVSQATRCGATCPATACSARSRAAPSRPRRRRVVCAVASHGSCQVLLLQNDGWVYLRSRSP